MNNKQFAVVATITFLVGMVWLITDIIFKTKASIPISAKLESSLEEVNPNFDSKVLDIIDKETLDKLSVTVPPPEASITPEVSPNPSQEASPSAKVQINPG